MNKLDLILATQGVETPTTVEIRALIERALLAKDAWDDTVLGPLVVAYHAALAAAIPERQVLYLATEAEAEAILTAAALEAYRLEFPQEPEDSGNVPSWPDALPYHGEFTKQLLQHLGAVLGYDAARRTKAYYAYCRRDEAGEVTT